MTSTADLLPLSRQQEFLCGFDKGDDSGPFGPRYTIVSAWRVDGRIDLPALHGAWEDVVARHDSLCTVLRRHGPLPGQVVHPAVAHPPEVRELPGVDPADRARQSEILLNDVEAGTVPIGRLPLAHLVIGRFDATDAVVVIRAHHTAVDGWSMQILANDLFRVYAKRCGHDIEVRPAPQYWEYALHQRTPEAEAARAARAGSWRSRLEGARLTVLPTDHPRRPGAPFSTSWYRFVLDAGLRRAAEQVAARHRSTLFMVLMAAFAEWRRRETGESDIIIPTFSPGRDRAWTHDVVGSFFNFLPIRLPLAGVSGTDPVVSLTRRACLDAFVHEVPLPDILEEVGDLMVPARAADRAACVFQVVQWPLVLRGERIGGLRVRALRRRRLFQEIGSDIPDGTLWTLEPHADGDLLGSVGFSRNIIDASSVERMVAGYTRVLEAFVGAPPHSSS